ncbi:hypothetical protein KP509_10G035400 [Ceratopteris richardii]|uniref:Uncharacterized protein n=1 Tax=Ceratopteris richardii TaxID=49495 RepID=A0A8T2U083_CERRI|nr:hypothetical protein KP509_10G035400 [Ceratopteris richardii]
MASMLLLSLLKLLLVAGVCAQQCPDESVPMVFPYWSVCYQPATYFSEDKYTYELHSVDSQRPGKLAAICEGSSPSYCNVTLSEENGAASQYMFTYISKEIRESVAQSDDVVMVNTESGRSLGWRQDADGEALLVEVADTENVTRFQFSHGTMFGLSVPSS